MDNPLDDPNTDFKYVLGILDLYFTIIFMIESVFKIISYGFIYNFVHPHKAYMRSYWNILDLFINITSIIDQSGALSTYSLKSLKSLRALRALRPLRVLTKNESLRLLVNALFQTIPVLASLAFVTLTSTWIFAIFLMSSFKGKFQYCSFPNIEKVFDQDFYKSITNKEDCFKYQGQWVDQNYNFDTIFLSVVSIFKIILGENWSLLMWASVDSSGIEQQPIENNTVSYQIVYYLLVFMGNIFTINLFTGLVVNNFKRIKDDISGYNTLTDVQRQWVEMQKFMMKRKLKVVIPNPSNYYRNICFKIQKSPIFEKIIIFFILVNLITMGCTFKGISQQGIDAINIINNTCLVIYHIEAFIKIMGVGIFFYFKNDWNKFDFCVIAITDAVLFSSLFISTSALSNLPVIFRALRLGRIVKYIRASDSLKVLIDSIYYLLPSLINIAALIFLLVFICAILGMNLFSQSMIIDKDSLYPFFDERVAYPYQYNFQTISGSFLIILQCIQNQNWDWYMSMYGYDQKGCVNQSYDDQRRDGINGCGSIISFPFFIIIIFFIRYIVINLFLALVIEGFVDTLRESEAVIPPDVLENIVEKWSEYDEIGSGFILPEQMYFLLLNIPEPIGLRNENLQNQFNINMSIFYLTNYINKIILYVLIFFFAQFLIHKMKNKKFHQNKGKKNKMQYISKKKIFEDLDNFNVRLYSNDKTHFMDFCVKLSRNAIIRKARDQNIQDYKLIDGRIVIEDSLQESLMKNWEAEYPSNIIIYLKQSYSLIETHIYPLFKQQPKGLKKYNKRKDEKDQPKQYFNILMYYAVITIQEYVRQRKREKNIQEQILKNKINSKMSKTENANNFTAGNNPKPKPINRRLEKRQMSHIYINQPQKNANSTPLTANSQPVHVQGDHYNPELFNIQGDFNLNQINSDKGEKIIENTPQKLNNESKAKFFQKTSGASGQNTLNNIFNNYLKKNQNETENKNQEALKKFQHFHNFTIKKNQLGQKFPIKYATDYESLRPTESQSRKVTIEEFTLIKNEMEEQNLNKRKNSKQYNTPSNYEIKQQEEAAISIINFPKNLKIEGLSEIDNGKSQMQELKQMNEPYYQGNEKSSKTSIQEFGTDQQVRSKKDLDIILDTNINDQNSNRDEQNPSESHSTEIAPSLKGQGDPKKNTFFIN